MIDDSNFMLIDSKQSDNISLGRFRDCDNLSRALDAPF